MNKNSINKKSINKVFEVIRVLFGTTAKKYPGFFVVEVIKMLAGIGQPFIALIVSPLIIDEIVGGRDLKKMIICAAIIIIGEAVFAITINRCDTLLNKYGERISNYFVILIGKHSMELDFQLTEDKATLEQIEKARTGMDWYSGGVHGIADQFFMFLGNAFKIVGFVTVISLHAPLLLAVMAVYVAINALLVTKRNGIELEAFGKLSKVNRLFGYFGWNIVDPRYGKDIRLYEAQDTMLGAWKDNTEKSNRHWKWQAETQFPYYLTGDMISVLRSIFAYFYVALLAIKGFYSVGIFSQLVAAEGALDATLGGLVSNVTELVKRCNYAYEYVVFMNYPAALVKGDRPVEKKPHEIEFRNVSFTYPGTDRKILDNISIRVAPGEHISIVGLNGAGKTTFIKLLCRLYDPTEGEILLDGVNIKEYDYSQYMEQFAPVFQDFKLFALTIRDNIVFGESEDPGKASDPDADKKHDASDEELGRLIKLVGLDEMVSGLDKGMDTNIFKFFDEEGVEPSGGEQQKIAIARALYKNSPVVILDEPTAALDPVAEYDIYRQFSTLVGGRSAFYISHRLSSCRFCDHIAVFSEGRIAEYGTHDELEKIPEGIYAKMFEAQAKYYR